MSTATLPGPSPTPTPAAAPARARRKPLIGPYLGYVGYFVGAGLISGGIVHHPLAPARYTLIAVAGVSVFLLATVINEVVLAPTRPAPRAMMRLVGASLLLSLGIGMLSGGIQHFMDFPTRAATLIPTGLLLSFAAYVLRHADAVRAAVSGKAAVSVAAAAVLSFVALQQVATALGDVGGHGHGSTVSETEHAAETEHEMSTVRKAASPGAVENVTAGKTKAHDHRPHSADEQPEAVDQAPAPAQDVSLEPATDSHDDGHSGDSGHAQH